MSTVYFEGNVETQEQSGVYGSGILKEFDTFESEKLSITFNGTKYALDGKAYGSGTYKSYMYGGAGETGPSFDNYPFVCVFGLNSNSKFNLYLYTSEPGTHSLKIESYEEGSDTEPSTYEPTLRVKDAMTHYVSTLDGVDEPAATIKKLTKQVLDPDGNNEAIQKARTIAQIWEQAAIERGYTPDN